MNIIFVCLYLIGGCLEFYAKLFTLHLTLLLADFSLLSLYNLVSNNLLAVKSNTVLFNELWWTNAFIYRFGLIPWKAISALAVINANKLQGESHVSKGWGDRSRQNVAFTQVLMAQLWSSLAVCAKEQKMYRRQLKPKLHVTVRGYHGMQTYG